MSNYMDTSFKISTNGPLTPEALKQREELQQTIDDAKLHNLLNGRPAEKGDGFVYSNPPSENTESSSSTAATQQSDPITSIVNTVSGIVGAVAKAAPIIGLLAGI